MKLDELIACRNLLVHMATDRYYEVSLTAPLESEYDVEAYELFGTIQDPRKVADNITDDILSNEDLKNKMNEIIEYIIRNLQEIIEQSISKYIVDNLFASIYTLNKRSDI